MSLSEGSTCERCLTRRNGKRIEFRTAGGTGARYHLELNFVCGDLADLDAGVYHHAAHDHALRQLRKGDFRGSLVAATGDEPSISRARVAGDHQHVLAQRVAF